MTVIALLLALTLTPHEQAAMHQLMTTRTFEYPHIGAAGTASNGFLALRVLAKSKNADAAFKELVAHAALAGQLYGLMGVSRTDPAFFRTVIEHYKELNEPVSVENGCMIMSEQVAIIVHDHRAVRLPAGTTLTQWLAANPKTPAFVDIAGGGLTSLFLDAPEPDETP
ncbi:MAG TPA: hypothetical protein VJ901_12600 [Thermoanaerobaculia bacterium]|nr:hypothetical protein [Thermoanaerobaculia bacterium]